MKRNDIFIIIATAVYSILFYNQLLGLNLLLFNIIIIALLLLRDKTLFKSKEFIITSSLALISATACYIHNSDWSIVMNVISLMLTATISINKENSIILNVFHSAYTHLSVIGYMIYDLFKKKENANESENKRGYAKTIILAIIPVLICLVFFGLYRESNLAFKLLSDKINLNIISWSWVGFTLFGFILMYALFLQRSFKKLNEADILKSDALFDKYNSNDESTYADWFQKLMSFNSELLTGVILFALINILTLSVNITDIIYTWSAHSLPKGATYSEFIHSGIASLITSIVFAIIIILFYFRGAINFYKENKTIKILAYIWILQNVFLILSTMLRNKMYVDTYSLTEKRVGVFIYLGLAILGLLLCFYKIATKRNNIFLFRKNTWAVYISLTLLSVIDWSSVISKYNIYRAKKSNNFYLDANYMGELNENNLETIWNYYQSLPEGDFRKQLLKEKIDMKINTILSKSYQYDFRSMTHQRQYLKNYISSLNNRNEINSISIISQNLENIEHLKNINNITELNLSYNHINDLDNLKYFTKLHTLDLSNNQLDTIDIMPELKQLKNLNLANNQIKEINRIAIYKQLEELDLSSNYINDISVLSNNNSIQTLDISSNPISNLSILSTLKNLKTLAIRQSISYTTTIPYIPTLENLDISNTRLLYDNNEPTINTEIFKQLTALNISNCYISNLNILEELKTENKLEELNLSDNHIEKMGDISYLNNLKKLIMPNNNNFNDALVLPNSLEVLDISNTKINDFKFLNTLSKLKELNLSNDDLVVMNKINLPALEKLNLSSAKYLQTIAEINMPNLKELDMNYCEKIDYKFISKLKNLEKIKVSSIDEDLGKILLTLPKLKKIECFGIDEKIYNQLISKNPSIWIIRNDNSRYDSFSSTSTDSSY